MFHLKICLLKDMVNFIETFCVIIKHFFNTVDVAQEWKNIHSFLTKHLLWTSNIISLFTLGSFSSLLAVRKLRGDILDLKIPEQVLPTFWLPMHNDSVSCK